MGIAERARATSDTPVVRVRGGTVERGSATVAGEEPLEIRIGGQRLVVTMRTPVPGRDAELALGFLIAEGIAAPGDIGRISECRSEAGDGGVADVLLRPGARPAAGWQRRFYSTAACGVCGKESIEAVRADAPPLPDGPQVPQAVLAALPDALRKHQRLFDRTGGLHAAALFDAAGGVVTVREDVGRHNAVDKVVGRAAMDGLVPLHDHLLMVSGRVSFEIVQKALMAGCPLVAAVSAPSSLAVRLARESNMTLVGFLRPDGYNVYAGAERIESA